MSHKHELARVLIDRQNIQFEEEVTRNPYHLRSWLKYLEYRNGNVTEKYILYERAIKFLPRSYKLWHAYLTLRHSRLDVVSITSKRYSTLVSTYERALVHMHKMPVIWEMYCKLMIGMRKGTATRKVFDRALQSLPITQHENIWKLYITWVKDFGVEETAIRVYRRYLMFDSSHRESFVQYLQSREQYSEATRQLAICVNDDHYISPSGLTKHQMWMNLCDMCASHPEEISTTLKVESIIRSGIARFSDEVGRLWTKLADYYICLGQFEKARDVYEEAIQAVVTVKDFTITFDCYAKFEESLLMAKMQNMNEENELEDGLEKVISSSDTAEKKTNEMDVELRLARLEHLMDSRPILLNSVVLRQNPHNVNEWHKRVKLMGKDDLNRVLMTYMEAIKAIDPKVVVGKLSSIWLGLARFYESHDDLENARNVMSKATQVEYRNVDELAHVWCSWAEMELKHANYDNALSVMQQAVLEPHSSKKRRQAYAAAIGKTAAKGSHDTEQEDMSNYSVADRLHKCVKVWNLYLDLEESLGTIETCRAAYDKVMDLKVVTPKMILNYVGFLEDNNLYEDSFRVFERAVTLFAYPHLYPIWTTYLDKFIARYEGTKLERLRDLFEECVKKLPAEFAAEIYIKYANAEEKYGLARHALAVYDRGTKAVPEAKRMDMYRLYIKKIEQYYGVTKTRPVFENAISLLPDDNARLLCLEYAEMETKLGEIDRARGIYQHGSQFADPRRDNINSYWKKWKSFEENHGNEDTFRDMLRIQRSVESAFSQVNYLASDILSKSSPEEIVGGGVETLVRQSEKENNIRQSFVSNTNGRIENYVAESNKRKFESDGDNMESNAPKARAANPDDIDIDDIGDSNEIGITTKPVPKSVFGSIAVPTTGTTQSVGALDRFAKAGK